MRILRLHGLRLLAGMVWAAVLTVTGGPASAAVTEVADGVVEVADADTIVLAQGSIYTLTVVHSDPGSDDPDGLPAVTSEIVVDGNDAVIERSAATGTPEFLLILVAGTGNLLLYRVTLRNGRTSGAGGGIAVVNGGTLRLSNSTVTGNVAGGSGGGGIFVIGSTLELVSTWVTQKSGYRVDRCGETRRCHESDSDGRRARLAHASYSRIALTTRSALERGLTPASCVVLHPIQALAAGGERCGECW